MNVVDFHKDRSRHNATAEAPLSVRPQKPPRPQSPQRMTTAEAGVPVPAPLVAHASSSDDNRGTLIPLSPGPKALGQSYRDSLNFVQPAPTPLHTETTHSFQPASESEYGTTDDEYHVLNKDDIPKLVSEFNQKPDGGWPKQASNVRWISEDQIPILATSGLVTAPPIGAFPKSSTHIQPSPFARFLSRPAKERKQSPIDVENQAVLSKPQTILGQTNNEISELEDKPKPLKGDAKLRTVIGQFGGPVAGLGLGSMYSG